MIRKAIYSDFPVLSKYYKEFDDNGIDLFNRGPFSVLMVYESDGNVVGFISYSIIYDRAEVDYIYVDENSRNHKIASQLLDFCVKDAITKGCLNVTLEVNEHNAMGIGLYKKFGFLEGTKRKNYYHGNDALLMIKELKDEK